MRLARPLVVFDVESTGVDPVKDRIIEFGAITLRPDGARSPRWVSRFNPGIPIPAEATAVHGIKDEDVKDCPKFERFAKLILQAFQGKDIAGYNLWRLDLPMLDEELRRCGLKLDLTGVNVIDCFGIFSKREPRKLEDAVRKYCGREHEGAHGAGADAEATLDVLIGQAAMYEDLGKMGIGEIAEYSRVSENKVADLAGKLYLDKEGVLRYAFGKYRGDAVADRLDYASWMLGANFPGSTCDVLREFLSRCG